MPRAFHPRPLAAFAGLALLAPTFATAETAYPGVFRADAFRDAVERDTTFRPITHQVELRFGMTYSSERGMQPGYGARYTMTLHHQMDNGWQVGVSLGVSLDNLNTPAPWRDRGIGRF